MADSEFEEFKQFFEQMPQHIRAKPQCYTLVCDITPCEERLPDFNHPPPPSSWLNENMSSSSTSEDSSDSLPLVDLRLATPVASGEELSLAETPPPVKEGRKRRKLPEIPNYIQDGPFLASTKREISLADELQEAVGEKPSPSRSGKIAVTCDRRRSRKHLTLTPLLNKHVCEESGSADSDIFGGTDVDSGHFSVHSPEPSSSSPARRAEGGSSPSSPGSLRSSIGGEPYPEADMLEATHRGLHRFVPRHHDEIEVDIGDPIYVQSEADDLWCEGVNLRTRRRGIFPSAYVVDAEYSEFDPNTPTVRKERYLLHYLGSVETMQHKGQQVLCSAVRRIREMNASPFPQACILEISDQGLRMVDKNKPPPNQVSCLDYFYALRNISFCGFHPTDHRYFGFITKHPTRQRFACHVFRGTGSTRPIAEAVGRAFQRFYQKYIETAYPVEEFFMEDEMSTT